MKNKKQKGSGIMDTNNLISASYDIVSSIVELSKSIFTEIKYINNTSNEISSGVTPSSIK